MPSKNICLLVLYDCQRICANTLKFADSPLFIEVKAA